MGTIQLPARSTRGKRIQQAIAEEEEQADNQFWNQEFFAEENQDEDYASEQSSEDVVDSDFDAPEEDDDDADGQDVAERSTKKKLKPPGSKPSKPKLKSGKSKTKAKAKDDAAQDEQQKEGQEDEGAAEGGAAAATDGKPSRAFAREAPFVPYEAPSLRRSTLVRKVEAEKERQRQEQTKAKRPASAPVVWKPMTQQELLAEAARTEVENLQSLKQLLAQEEETKRKALVVKAKYSGPLVKQRSRKVDGREQTLFELCNMPQPPKWLLPAKAPPPKRRAVCSVTGQPARYRDPQTLQPFATIAAFRKLRGLPPLPPGAAAPPPAPVVVVPGFPTSGGPAPFSGAGSSAVGRHTAPLHPASSPSAGGNATAAATATGSGGKSGHAHGAAHGRGGRHGSSAQQQHQQQRAALNDVPLDVMALVLDVNATMSARMGRPQQPAQQQQQHGRHHGGLAGGMAHTLAGYG